MTLGEIIKKYREEHHMSMDTFAEKSGMSKAYISLLEKNKHPKTGKPIAPSIQSIKQAADAMGIDFNKLFGMIDGDVDITGEFGQDRIQKKTSANVGVTVEVSNYEEDLFRKYRSLDQHQRQLVDDLIYTLYNSNNKK